MNILLVNKFHFHNDGATRAYFDTARILEERGHKVAFFSMKHPRNIPTLWEKYFVSNADYHASSSIAQKWQMAKNIWWNREAQRNLENLLQEFRPDVAHLHVFYHQISPSIIATLKKYKIPIAMTLHDYKLICPNYSMFVRGRIWEGGAIRCMMDRCVKDSFMKSMVCTLERIFHNSLGIYETINIFLSPSEFLKKKFLEHRFRGEIRCVSHPMKKAVSFSSQREYKEPYYFFAGRLSKEKGVDVLLRAMAKLPDAKLRIAGDGPNRKYLETLAKTLLIENRVEFLGHLPSEAVQQEIISAKAVIVPSVWYENMPYAILEALAVGAVVVASNIGGIPERIVDGENGFLFEAGNSKNLAEVLKNLKRKNLEIIRRQATASVADLTEDRYYRELLDVYQFAIKKDTY
jgi:glycosyltransferase involved in cell wall biosynthesis